MTNRPAIFQILLKWLHVTRFQIVRHSNNFFIIILLLIAIPRAQSKDYGYECQNLCDKNRDPDWNGAYVFDCDKKYVSATNRENCRQMCGQCPDSVCNTLVGENIFNCPKRKLKYGKCMNRCDRNRGGKSGGYKLKCQDLYDFSDQYNCKNECGECPSWVCNPKVDSGIYNCPPSEAEDFCEEKCDNYRGETSNDGNTGPFQFKCSDLSDSSGQKKNRKACERNCNECRKICEVYSNSDYVQDADYGTWKCPSKSVRQALPTTIKERPTKYGGTCKKRCDKFRSGGKGCYKLNCNTLFSSESERENCAKDCQQCPKERCDDSLDTLDCPALDGSTRNCDFRQQRKKKKLKPTQPNKYSRDLIIAVFFDGFMLALLVIALCACWQNRGRGGSQIQPQPTPTIIAATTEKPQPAVSAPNPDFKDLVVE